MPDTSTPSDVPSIRLARHAMATRFEMILEGSCPVALRSAGEDAMDEIERWERKLSLYRAGSDVWRINLEAGKKPVKVEPQVFRLLEYARRLGLESDGAFDITAGPLVRAWGFQEGQGRRPSPEVLDRARAASGWEILELDETRSTVFLRNVESSIDLGSIGKGFAMEVVVQQLQDAGVFSALVHGGTSTVCAIGTPSSHESWKVSLPASEDGSRVQAGSAVGPQMMESPEIVSLRNESLSVSASWGKAFFDEGQLLGHVIDPRSGDPVCGARLAALVLPSPTDSDALSTALLVLGQPGIQLLQKRFPQARIWMR